jgi:hypothetical protein
MPRTRSSTPRTAAKSATAAEIAGRPISRRGESHRRRHGAGSVAAVTPAYTAAMANNGTALKSTDLVSIVTGARG